jgi:glycosyltransferase involved in cell wall biosynthesis
MISVALCTYNGEGFLENQLRTILNQTLIVDEIVICDDCSTDETLQIIIKFKRDFSEIIRIYRNDVRLGAKKNFEKAILLCKGDIIFLSDQDDIWERDKVEKTLSYFNSNLDKSAVFTNGILINTDGQYLNQTLWDGLLFSKNFRWKLLENDLNYLFEYILNYGNIATGATIAFKKEAVSLFTPFPKEVLDMMWHDEWIALKLSSENKIGIIDECLIKYRIHDSQQIGIPLDTSIIEELRNFNNRSIYGPFLVDEYFSYVSFYCILYKKIIHSGGLNQLVFKDQTWEKLIKAKKRFLQQDNYIKKKLRLFKWWLKKDYFTEFLDLFRL